MKHSIRFTLLPVLDKMLTLYESPRDDKRFNKYLELLTGDTDNDLALPIMSFNPMARDHVFQKLQLLKQLNAEKIVEETLKEINQEADVQAEVFKVTLGLADDLKGGWTNRFTTDYDSKFKLSGLYKRNFCSILLWSSEVITEEIIKNRTKEYGYRTLFWDENHKPETLEDHICQESRVLNKAGISSKPENYEQVANFYEAHKSSISYPVIFNFLYGDDACLNLGLSPMGITEPMTGFKFATSLG